MKTIPLIALLVSSVFSIPGFSQDLPEGPGKDLVIKVCTSCHGAENFTDKRNTKEDWKAVVQTMIEFGAEVSSEQAEIIVNYLTKNFGKSAVNAKVNEAVRRR